MSQSTLVDFYHLKVLIQKIKDKTAPTYEDVQAAFIRVSTEKVKDILPKNTPEVFLKLIAKYNSEIQNNINNLKLKNPKKSFKNDQNNILKTNTINSKNKSINKKDSKNNINNDKPQNTKNNFENITDNANNKNTKNTIETDKPNSEMQSNNEDTNKLKNNNKMQYINKPSKSKMSSTQNYRQHDSEWSKEFITDHLRAPLQFNAWQADFFNRLSRGQVSAEEIINAFEGIEYFDLNSYFPDNYPIDKIIFVKHLILEHRVITKPNFKLEVNCNNCDEPCSPEGKYCK